MLLLASSRGVARGGHGGAFARTSLICAHHQDLKIYSVAIVKSTLLLLTCTERSGIGSVITLVTSRVTKVRSRDPLI